MRIHVGTDHAGFELKNDLVERLRNAGWEVVDHGAHVYDADDDYPAFCIAAAEAAVAGDEVAIVIGGSGNGEQIAANKVRGARAVLATVPEHAELGREHNLANVLSLGARFTPANEAWAIVQAFLATPVGDGERHVRRVATISSYEARQC